MKPPGAAWLVALALLAMFTARPGVADERPVKCQHDRPLSIGVVEDPQRSLTLQQVLALPAERFWALQPGNFPVDFSHSAFWLRFSLQAPQHLSCMNWLSVGEPRLNDVLVYVRHGMKWSVMKAGRDHPVDEWATQTMQPLFPLHLAQGERVEVVVRVTSRGVMAIDPVLRGDLELMQDGRWRGMVDGFVLGLVLLIVPVSLIVGMQIRSSLLLTNAGALSSYVLLTCVANGYLFYLPAYLSLSSYISSVLGGLSLILLMAYLHVLFDVRLMPSLWRYVFFLGTLSMGGLLFAGVLFDYTDTRQMFSLASGHWEYWCSLRHIAGLPPWPRSFPGHGDRCAHRHR